MNPTHQPTDRFATPLPSVDTTGATPAEILRVKVPEDGAVVIDVDVKAERTDGTFGVATFRRHLVVENNGGTLTVRGDNAPVPDYNPASYGGPSVSVSGTEAIVSLTGKASTPLSWRVLGRAFT